MGVGGAVLGEALEVPGLGGRRVPIPVLLKKNRRQRSPRSAFEFKKQLTGGEVERARFTFERWKTEQGKTETWIG